LPRRYDRSWEYFEHIQLPRRLDDAVGVELAEPGEAELKTSLIPICGPSARVFGAFGVGVAAYFSTLVTLAAIFLVAGVINVTNVYHFSSSVYSASQLTVRDSTVMLTGSAYCDQTAWVACTDCTPSQ
jgi:hypothetical protein